jgi:hypothetical protein
MKHDHYALVDVAQSIAATENRLSQLRDRVQRLKDEGSDAAQAEDLARALSFKLGQLYSRQSMMRRRNWTVRQL